ncbi:MAG: hypothetical protein ABIJ34_08670 [archaeon]
MQHDISQVSALILDPQGDIMQPSKIVWLEQELGKSGIGLRHFTGKQIINYLQHRLYSNLDPFAVIVNDDGNTSTNSLESIVPLAAQRLFDGSNLSARLILYTGERQHAYARFMHLGAGFGAPDEFAFRTSLNVMPDTLLDTIFRAHDDVYQARMLELGDYFQEVMFGESPSLLVPSAKDLRVLSAKNRHTYHLVSSGLDGQTVNYCHSSTTIMHPVFLREVAGNICLTCYAAANFVSAEIMPDPGQLSTYELHALAWIYKRSPSLGIVIPEQFINDARRKAKALHLQGETMLPAHNAVYDNMAVLG